MVEWRCPRCRARNTDANTRSAAFCFNCREKRPGIVDEYWYCLTCHKRNLPSKKNCVQCNLLRPSQGAGASDVGPSR